MMGALLPVYENNHLVRAATRGNGEQGDDITQNAKAIRSIPLWVDFSSVGIYKAELRGEVLINKNTFNDLNILDKKRRFFICQSKKCSYRWSSDERS